jgi:hypothetical protein
MKEGAQPFLCPKTHMMSVLNGLQDVRDNAAVTYSKKI